jgi:hypothetical protein
MQTRYFFTSLCLAILSAAWYSVSAFATHEWIDPCENGNSEYAASLESIPGVRKRRSMPLAGIRQLQVRVTVGKFKTGEENEIIDSVKKQVAEKLANAGIKCIGWTASSPVPVLNLDGSYVEHHPHEGFTMKGLATVEVYQTVKPERNPSVPFTILTWRRARDVDSFHRQAIVSQLLESVDVLISDWLSANPRQPAK